MPGHSGVEPFSAAELVSLYEPPVNWSATALAFDPTRSGELWVTLRRFPDSRPCNSVETQQSGCASRVGQVALVKQATTTPSATILRDGNAWHFMRRPTAIAFGDNGNFATCGEARTDNYEDETVDYSGPALWSSDPEIFGVKPEPGQNGTHLDMLHETPFCMGMAHERDNVYFAFNGQRGAIDRYDFKHPHVIGGEDHSDGELQRYVEGELLRVEEVPSHMAFDRVERKLYIADTGHQRVVRLSVDTGMPGPDVPAFDPIAVHRAITGALLEEVVGAGTVAAPSGIALSGDFVIVSDHLTSFLFWFGRDGSLRGSLDTGLPKGSLAGVSVGPDRKLYVSDMLTGKAYRLEPR